LKKNKLSKLPQSFDARDWAAEWLEVIKNHTDIPTDEGTMISWFANALMSGYDEANRRNRKKIERMERKMKSLIAENKGLKFYAAKKAKSEGVK
jgi:hypothetical protein